MLLLEKTLKNFNSIKVQLEHNDEFHSFRTVEFQFHKGTIRTNRQVSTQI